MAGTWKAVVLEIADADAAVLEMDALVHAEAVEEDLTYPQRTTKKQRRRWSSTTFAPKEQ